MIKFMKLYNKVSKLTLKAVPREAKLDAYSQAKERSLRELGERVKRGKRGSR